MWAEAKGDMGLEPIIANAASVFGKTGVTAIVCK